MEAMDDESVDINRLMDRIVGGILYHPAQRRMGSDGISDGRQTIFNEVKGWWDDMSEQRREDYLRKLSREGVENGENHKEGVQDTGHGHGCVGKLKMRKMYGEPQTMEDKIAGAAADAIMQSAGGVLSGFVKSQTGMDVGGGGNESSNNSKPSDSVGGLISGLLGGVFGKNDTEGESTSRRNDDGSYTEARTEYGRHGDRFGQAQEVETRYPDGERETEYRRYEQRSTGGDGEPQGYGYERHTEVRREHGRLEEHTTERELYGGGYGRQETLEESYSGGGGYVRENRREERRDDSYGGGYADQQAQSSYGGGGGGYSGRQEEGYGGGYGNRQAESYGGGYESQPQERYGGGGSSSRGNDSQASYSGGYDGGRHKDEGRHESRHESRHEGRHGHHESRHEGHHRRNSNSGSEDESRRHHRRRDS